MGAGMRASHIPRDSLRGSPRRSRRAAGRAEMRPESWLRAPDRTGMRASKQRRGSQGALWEPMSKRAYTRDW
ncbi:hypothetical protein HMPREF0762_01634 [Slackia exigua ATCC 700122]|uniref:Uncharacterized protein n=1 Tax=Slackia exigua (strain ATCC 700122 / DSM 15923 / CIP 105133 / JCM 11022 / KCTC 5966 / S-7) TaxID=649764 RepID=D0WIF9_SLAES|nr:hypothetical protein HMPREF0762_01634 [Slackia exigua ATCC 700122]